MGLFDKPQDYFSVYSITRKISVLLRVSVLLR
jgi:hypothetical protein